DRRAKNGRRAASPVILSGMSKRRYVLTFISLVLLPLMLFHFQNCAPPSASQTGNTGGSVVGIVDNLNKSQIQFVTTDAQIQDEAPSADISGLCARDRDGAGLKWAVYDEQNNRTPLAIGVSHCDHGQFAVTLESMDQYVCGVSHMLVVEGDWGASTMSRFSRRCQPLISVQETAPDAMPLGTTCSLEYSPASAADQPCQRVCYRSNQVVFSQPLDVTQCSSLAASLAGP
ncbi:MAG: hypothetical protein ACXVA9_10630, partial [Bdellovibrionales bacterium]